MHGTLVCSWTVLEVLQVLRPQPHVLIHGSCSLIYCHSSALSLCSLLLSLLQALSGLYYIIIGNEKKWTLPKIQTICCQHFENDETKRILPSAEWVPNLSCLVFSWFPQGIFKTHCGWSTVTLVLNFNKFHFVIILDCSKFSLSLDFDGYCIPKDVGTEVKKCIFFNNACKCWIFFIKIIFQGEKSRTLRCFCYSVSDFFFF